MSADLVSRVRARLGDENRIWMNEHYPRSSHAAQPASASADAIARAEARLGKPLPALLRTLYLEVGNGGFGPGFGLLGVAGGFPDDRGHDALALWEQWTGEPPPGHQAWAFPPRYLPIAHWGCSAYSCVDLDDPAGRVVRFWADRFVPVEEDEDEEIQPTTRATFAQLFEDEAPSLTDWLERWLAGTLAF